VRQQISIDSCQHKAIEEIKENLKKTAMKEFEEWKVCNERKEKKGKYN
jgi:hypothetical protein